MHHIQVFLLNVFLQVFQYIPEKSAMALGKGLGLVWFYLIRYRRRLVLRNLELALGQEKNERERYHIARDNFIHYGLNLVEFFRLPFFKDEDFKRTVTILDTTSFDRALLKKKKA